MTTAPGQRPAAAALITAAVLLAASLVVVAALAAKALRERDEAVRQGILGGLANRLEQQLRESGPTGAAEAVRQFGEEHAAEVVGVQLSAGERTLASWGATAGDHIYETGLLPGPLWRGSMGHLGLGRGAGQGRGGPPLRLRLVPGLALGHSGGLAWLLVVGAAVAGLVIVGLALAAVRGMAERERRRAVEAEGERLEAVALAGAGLAHRIRNPLGAIKGTAQLMAGELESPQRERAGRIVAASERLESLIGRLLAFARPPDAHPERMDLGELTAAVIGRAPGPVALDAAAPVAVFADREHVESILEELVANARTADPGGALEVRVERMPDGSGSVTVADRGPGPGVDPARAFQPYVTSRPDGTGLGLPIVRALARANRGDVSLEARPGGGAVARLRLPPAER